MGLIERREERRSRNWYRYQGHLDFNEKMIHSDLFLTIDLVMMIDFYSCLIERNKIKQIRYTSEHVLQIGTCIGQWPLVTPYDMSILID